MIAFGLALLFSITSAQARPSKLGLGLFCPELGLNPYELFDEVNRIAGHLAKATGVTVSGKAYKTQGDLNADLRADRIQFAVVGPFYLATTPSSGRVLAVAAQTGQAGRNWTLMATSQKGLLGLEGQTLQLPNVSARVEDFVEFGLLDGNLAPRKFFKIVKSPGVLSAAEAVRLGAAAVVLAPADTAGLVPLLPRTLQVPAPAVVLLSRELPDDLVAQLKAGLLSYRGAGRALPRFTAGDVAPYVAFSAQRRRRRLPLVAATPEVSVLDEKTLLEPFDLQLELPELPMEQLFSTKVER